METYLTLAAHLTQLPAQLGALRETGGAQRMALAGTKETLASGRVLQLRTRARIQIHKLTRAHKNTHARAHAHTK